MLILGSSALNKLDEMKVKLSSFEIIIVSETWLNSTIDDSIIQWDGFKLVRQDRDLGRVKRGGGLCVYIKEHIDFEVLNELTTLINNNIEFIHLKFKAGMQKPINILCVYRPPDGSHKEFVRSITQVLDLIDRTRSDTIVFGDFDIDYNNKNLRRTSKFDMLESKYALMQMIKENTRITDASSSRIHLLFTDLQHSSAGVINYKVSDHLPIFLTKEKSKVKVVKRSLVGRSYLHYNKEVFSRLPMHLIYYVL